MSADLELAKRRADGFRSCVTTQVTARGERTGRKLSEKTTGRLGYGFLAICGPANSMVVDTNVQGR
jgi:hypothetical protein